MIRAVALIDEELCDGCGECVPACAEEAIQIVEGKARLVSDDLCDGLGACLGHCPQGAIRIEQREAAPSDETAVQRHITDVTVTASHESELRQWPVQLRLVPFAEPSLRASRWLVAADCVPVAYRDFHSELLRDHAVVIACPKLDDKSGYVDKLAEMIRRNDPAEVTVAHMEVPCCTGILHLVLEARRLAESSVPVEDLSIGVRGQIVSRRWVLDESMAPQPGQSACCQAVGGE
jgi:NAD-dependent dihydropyrimidine dehydrogenase PreA subunit